MNYASTVFRGTRIVTVNATRAIIPDDKLQSTVTTGATAGEINYK